MKFQIKLFLQLQVIEKKFQIKSLSLYVFFIFFNNIHTVSCKTIALGKIFDSLVQCFFVFFILPILWWTFTRIHFPSHLRKLQDHFFFFTLFQTSKIFWYSLLDTCFILLSNQNGFGEGLLIWWDSFVMPKGSRTVFEIKWKE